MSFSVLQRFRRTVKRMVERFRFSNLRYEVLSFAASVPGRVLGRTGLDCARWLRSRSDKFVLVIDHCYGGGSRRYRDERVEKLIERGDGLVLIEPDPLFGLFRISLMCDSGQVSIRWATFRMVRRLLSELHFELLVFNNAVAFRRVLGVVGMIRDLVVGGGVGRFEFLVHDYYSACPSWALIDGCGSYCGVPHISQCRECLPRNKYAAIPGQDIYAWRAAWGGLLSCADEIRFFSESSLLILRKAYPFISSKNISIVPHVSTGATLRPVTLARSERLVVGVVGSLSWHKGSGVVRDLAEYIRAESIPISIVVIGTVDVSLPSDVCFVAGGYQRHQLPGLLEKHGIGVAFFSSICPETYSYVVDELMEMGVPVLAFDIGAPPERLAKYAKSKILSSTAPADIVAGALELWHVSQ